MNIIYSTILLISTIFSGVIGFPISTEFGPVVVKQNKPIIYSPANETIIKPIKAIVPPPPPPAPPGPIDDILPAKYITIDGIVIYTPKDASPFILPSLLE
jgi:hypothetical protein